MAVDDDHDGICSHEEVLSYGERMIESGSAGEVLTRIELDLASSSEKLLNLDILLMHVASRVIDYEALAMEDETISTDTIGKAFEFDILSGILNSEVKELDSFMTSLQREIIGARQSISLNEHFKVSLTEVEEKLQDAEDSLKQLQDQVAEIRMQLEKFERTLAFGLKEPCNGVGEELPENGDLSSVKAKWKMQTVEQQRHILQMLEKSLARELDLEKKLSDSRHNEELKLKLHYAEREADYMEESMEVILEKFFEAENASVVLMGISKELMGKLQIVQFNLNGLVHRESEMRSRLQESTLKLSAEESASSTKLDDFLVQQANDLKSSLKDAEDKCIVAKSEALILREKVNSLEEQLKKSDIQLEQAQAYVGASQEQQNLLHSEFTDMENVIEDLKENILKAESRAENAEAKCTLLTEANMELNEELSFLKSNGAEKANLLERKLKVSDDQLEHAKASVEASNEHQTMLYSALSDMENLIEDLKEKISKAESRTESTESKCTLLTETNLELNEELGFLRSRLECLETSLHQADDAKEATAKDISIKTKIITDLVMKLALERERLQIQIFTLMKENKILAEKCWKRNNNAPVTTNYMGNENEREFALPKSFDGPVTESSTTNYQVENSAAAMGVCESVLEPTVSEEDATGAASKVETVRTIEAGQLNSKQVVMAILVLLISVLGVYLFQLQRCPF